MNTTLGMVDVVYIRSGSADFITKLSFRVTRTKSQIE
jgi:hypothetical protein